MLCEGTRGRAGGHSLPPVNGTVRGSIRWRLFKKGPSRGPEPVQKHSFPPKLTSLLFLFHFLIYSVIYHVYCGQNTTPLLGLLLLLVMTLSVAAVAVSLILLFGIRDKVLHRVILGGVADKPVSVFTRALGLGNVDQIILKEDVNIRHVGRLARENVALSPSQLSVLELEVDKDTTQLIRGGFQESAELANIHSGIQVQVTLKRRSSDGIANVSHEDLAVVSSRRAVKNRVLKVRNAGRNKLGCGKVEQLLKDGQGIGTSTLHLVKLITELLAQTSVDNVVESSGVEGHTNGEKSVHLVGFFRSGIELSRSVDVLGS